jgi:signal transduction histidine kinase
MTSHEQAHAFDPFFTTKLGRGGSGIGLAVCHRIVSSVLGGEMKLTSAPGKGASFALDIPVTAPGRI